MTNVSRQEKTQILLSTGLYKKEELDLLQDSILDDLYLKYLIVNGKVKKEDVSKPWVTNYQDRPHKFLNVNQSLYQNYVEANEDNQQGVAIYDINHDRIIKHNELLQLIDAFSNGLQELGIGEDSKVSIIINGSYEEPMCLLSPNKNKSLVRYIDFTKNPTDVLHDIEMFEPDLLIMDEMFLPMEPFANVKKKPVIVLNSKMKCNNSNYILFEDMLKLGASRQTNESNESISSKPSVIINSSGTTGLSKPIVHSNQTINSVTQKLFFSDYPMKRGNFAFKSIPSHIGLGLMTTLYANLISGTGIMLSNVESPEQSIEEAIKCLASFKQFLQSHNFDKNSQLLEFFAPMYVRIIEQNHMAFNDLSYVGGILSGGSKMTEEELKRQTTLFRKKGLKVPICNGYGQNEFAGAVALNDNTSNVNGSAGYPVIGTEIKVIDMNTKKELEPFKEGRIIEKGDSKFLEYFNMPQETENAKIIFNGEEWFDTKDLGYFDNNGHVFITGRVSRVIIRYDVKISMDKIENKIKNNKYVKNCAIVGLEYNDEEVPYAFVELNDGVILSNEELIEIIQNSDGKLNHLEMPIAFRIIEHLPLLSNSKIDYKTLKEEAKKDYDDGVKKLIKS